MPIYKYTDINGAINTLIQGTIRFSSPSTFNDPFDVSIQAVFAYDPTTRLDELQQEFQNVVYSETEWPSNNGSKVAQAAAILRAAFLSADRQKRAAIRQDPSKPMWNADYIRVITQEILEELKRAFVAEGVFCGSKRPDNHALWAHYAENHTGVVFELMPSIEQDSLLQLCRDVEYTDNRPKLYESPKDFIEKTIFYPIEKVLNEYNNKISMSKSTDWSYEEELRVCIPRVISSVHPFYIHKLHDNELKSVSFGCRMSPEIRDRIVRLARQYFPNAGLYQMVPDTHQYRMNSVAL